MIGTRLISGTIVALVMSRLTAAPSISEDAAAMPPFQAHVDMKNFMQHVLGPAAASIWKVNGLMIDAKGEHDLSPKSDDDWEQVVSGAATLAEATNALMIPERARESMWSTGKASSSLARSKQDGVLASEWRSCEGFCQGSASLWRPPFSSTRKAG